MKHPERQLFATFKQHMQELPEGALCGIAYSGGLDSTVLLHALHRWPDRKFGIVLLYIDHELRPLEERQKEAALVVNNALGTGVPLYCHALGTGTVAQRAQQDSCGIEAAARKLRYQAFDQWIKQLDLAVVFTAHHKSDDVEGLVMSIFQGQTFSRILPRSRPPYFRPFLDVPRRDLARIAESWNLVWHEESTNASTRYLRNKVRHTILPPVAAAFPGFEAGILRLRQLAVMDNAYLDALLEGIEWQEKMLELSAEGYCPGQKIRVLCMDQVKLSRLPDSLLWRAIEKGARRFLQAREIRALPDPLQVIQHRQSFAELRDGDLVSCGELRFVHIDGCICMAPHIVLFHKNDYLVQVTNPGEFHIPGYGEFLVEPSTRPEIFPFTIRPLSQWGRILFCNREKYKSAVKKLALLSGSSDFIDRIPVGRCADDSFICFTLPWKGAWNLDFGNTGTATRLDTIRLQRRLGLNCEQSEQ